MDKILELREKRVKAWEAAKAFLDEKTNKDGTMSAEDSAQYDKMEKEVVDLGKQIERLERQKAIDDEMNKPVNKPILEPIKGQSDEKTGRASDEYHKAFWNAIRTDGNFITPDVRNVLQVGTDSDGGYLVPDEFEPKLIQELEEQNIMRQLATVITTSSGERKIPVVATHGEAYWAEENSEVTESDETFGLVMLGAHKVWTMLKISDELLNDSAFNLEAYVAQEFGRRIGQKEEAGFINGDGDGKPLGILAADGGAEVGVTAAAADKVTVDELIDLYYSLKEPYRKNATFLMGDDIIKNIRKLKDSNGQYLWQPALTAGTPDMILNRPVRTSAYVPKAEASARSIAFGDFSYYWIADRQSRNFKRLGELFATKGQVGFLTSQRVDGKLILPEAVKVLQQKGA